MKSFNSRSTLLMLIAIFSITSTIETKQQQQKNSKSVKPVSKNRKPSAPLRRRSAQPINVQSAPQVLASADEHDIARDEQLLKPNEVVTPSIDSEIVENNDGSIVQTVTKTEVVDNKVVTTSESWTWYDYAKLAAATAAVAGGLIAYDAFFNDSNNLNYLGNQAATAGQYTQENLNSGFNYLQNKFQDGKSRLFGAPAAVEIVSEEISVPQVMNDQPAQEQAPTASDDQPAQNNNDDNSMPTAIPAISENSANPSILDKGAAFAEKYPATTATLGVATVGATAYGAKKVNAARSRAKAAELSERQYKQNVQEQSNKLKQASERGDQRYLNKIRNDRAAASNNISAVDTKAIVPYNPAADTTKAIVGYSPNNRMLGDW